MKRLTTIFLLLCYLFFNTGISYSMHFCGEKLTSSEIFKSKKGCVCSTTQDSSNDCCNDIHIESSTDEQQAAVQFKISLEKSFLGEISFYLVEFERLLQDSFDSFPLAYQSPPFYKVPKFIFNQIFRL